MVRKDLFANLLKKLPRKEDQTLLSEVVAAYEKEGAEGVKNMLEEEIRKTGGE